MTTKIRKPPGPKALFRDKVRAPVSLTLTPEHHPLEIANEATTIMKSGVATSAVGGRGGAQKPATFADAGTTKNVRVGFFPFSAVGHDSE